MQYLQQMNNQGLMGMPQVQQQPPKRQHRQQSDHQPGQRFFEHLATNEYLQPQSQRRQRRRHGNTKHQRRTQQPRVYPPTMPSHYTATTQQPPLHHHAPDPFCFASGLNQDGSKPMSQSRRPSCHPGIGSSTKPANQSSEHRQKFSSTCNENASVGPHGPKYQQPQPKTGPNDPDDESDWEFGAYICVVNAGAAFEVSEFTRDTPPVPRVKCIDTRSPATMEEAIHGEFDVFWRAAIQKEIDTLLDCDGPS